MDKRPMWNTYIIFYFIFNNLSIYIKILKLNNFLNLNERCI